MSPFTICGWGILLLGCVMPSHAAQDTHYNEALPWAQQTQSSITDRIDPQSIEPLLCEDTSCSPPWQEGLTPAQIEHQKNQRYFTDDVASSLADNFNRGRPNPALDRSYRHALIGQQFAKSITHGESGPYIDCEAGRQCQPVGVTKTCERSTDNPVVCEKLPVFQVSSVPVTYVCPEGWQRTGRYCQGTEPECRYDERHFVSSSGGNCGWVNSTTYIWEGRRTRAAEGRWRGEQRYHYVTNCRGGEHDGWRKRWEICAMVSRVEPAQVTCPTDYTLSGHTCIRQTLTWHTECPLTASCRRTSERCIEPEETRDINGLPVTLPCWRYHLTHHCAFEDTCAAFSDCQFMNAECSLTQQGICVLEQVSLQCQETSCHHTELICGETSFCLDGDCYEARPRLSSDFNRAASALSALAAAATQLGEPPILFKGRGMDCSVGMVGFRDCCADGGWGQGLGYQCSETEQALGHAKEAETTVYLGTFCAERVLGVCTRTKKAYCVFDNKLARIIQHQGAVGQLGLSLGTPERPLCQGITPQQLQGIRFDHLDFHDFYQDLHDGTQVPDATEIKQRLLTAYGGQR
ncbi:putative Mating pair stabilization protein TraN [Vibrio nigripulchritudo SO65]|uniref:type-F conjugative transfer system mating-pair stabilization protein TraN n=1 Tax=Vibrio nigripulchritudo TaxID=28173 RepID=UPI0003B236AF|nr:type-F conjugative transfer system mating-pair stabilization protein TraN [Vibrio nigripulchritudo]CCN38671.1 putative Mating pair stabilization protein TraN [Vibrio nigripulchritudo AM115]CCN44980.1 putative Mating pair stabilization protein TraN [Vibrio nigripulchritudo FTn2]CCN79738.1 putative Mating pair stabilization protein TraN [Vibrio nigripulchritudo SO65]